MFIRHTTLWQVNLGLGIYCDGPGPVVFCGRIGGRSRGYFRKESCIVVYEFSVIEQGLSNATPGTKDLLIHSMIFIQSVRSLVTSQKLERKMLLKSSNMDLQ